MTRDQEYQTTVCVRELKDGATPGALRRQRYAEGAIKAAQAIIEQQEKAA